MSNENETDYSLREFIPYSAYNAPAKKTTYNIRVANVSKLDDITTEFGATKSGIINALIAREWDRMFEAEETEA
jgi:hypothetical protein